MKTIGIKQFQEIVSDVLDNPDKYAGKSIILWNSHPGPDSIEYNIVEDCCVRYNKLHRDNQVWFKELLYLGNETTYHITTSRVICEREDMYGWKKRGIVLDDGIISPFKPSEEEISQWLNFVNRREYQGEILSSDWILIACAQERSYHFTEDMFSENCYLYEFKPSLDEWVEWMKDKCDENELKPIVEFIKETGSSIDLFYWGIALTALKRKLRHKEYDCINQLSHEDFDDCLREYLASRCKGFPYNELWDFIQAHQEFQ